MNTLTQLGFSGFAFGTACASGSVGSLTFAETSVLASFKDRRGLWRQR